MKKLLIILLFFSGFIFADGLKVIHSISDIPKNKNVVLIFAMEYCPYCKRQEKSIIKKIQPKFPTIEFLKVMKGTKVFQELIYTGNFGEVDFFPTTYILQINEKNKFDVKYPFTGLQRSSNIIRILNDKEIMD